METMDSFLKEHQKKDVDLSKFQGGGRWLEYVGPVKTKGHKVATGFSEEYRGETKTISSIWLRFQRDTATNEHVCDLHQLAAFHAQEYYDQRMIAQTREDFTRKAQEILKQIWEYILRMPEWKMGYIVERIPWDQKQAELRKEQMDTIPKPDMLEYLEKQGFKVELPPGYASERIPQSPETLSSPPTGTQPQEEHLQMDSVGRGLGASRLRTEHSKVENLF